MEKEHGIPQENLLQLLNHLPQKKIYVCLSNSGKKFSKHLLCVHTSLLIYNKCHPFLHDTIASPTPYTWIIALLHPSFQKEYENSPNNLSGV